MVQRQSGPHRCGRSRPYAIPADGDLRGHDLLHENGTTADGGVIDWFIQSSDFYLGQAEQTTLVRGMWPDFEQQVGAISLTVGLRKYPQGDVTEKGPYTLAAGTTKKDFMISGRIAHVKFSGSSAPASMRMGKPIFDVKAAGLQ